MSTNDRALIEAALAAGKLQKVPTGVSGIPLPVWDGKQLKSPDWKARLAAAQSVHYRGLQARKTKEAIARRAEIAEHHAVGHCTAEIARIVGAPVDTVRADLRLLGLAPHRPPKPEVPPHVLARNERLAQIIGLNWTWKQIAADVGLTVGTVQAIAQRLRLRKPTSPRAAEVPAMQRRAEIARLLKVGVPQAEIRKRVCPGAHSRQWGKDLAILGVSSEAPRRIRSAAAGQAGQGLSAAEKRRALIEGLLAEGLTQSDVRAKFRKAFPAASRYWQRDLAALSIVPEVITHLPPDTPQRVAALNRRAAIKAALDAGETQEAVRARHGAISRQWRKDLAALGIPCEIRVDVFGLGAAIGGADGIASAALIEAANVCDETVAKVGGGTEPRYSCNGILDTAVDPKSNIEGLLTAMAGTCGWQAGQWQIYAGAYRTPLLSLTSDDIVEAGLSVTTRISRAENFNCVRGTFVAPENDWQQDDFPAYRSAVYIAEDGGETIWRDIVLPYTISASMAQRLAKIEVERNRRQLTVFLDGKLKCWQAAIGDTVSLTYARWGWSSKPFEVSKVNLGVSASDDGALLTAQLALRETSPLVYDWATSEAQVYAAAPRTTLPSAFDIAQPGNLTITESKLVTRDGRGVSAVARLDWLLAPGPFVQQYEIQTRLAGGEWVTQGRTDQLFWEVNDIQPGDWEFRVKSLSGTGVSSPWRMVSQVIYGLFDIPVELANASIQSAGGFAILKWALSDDIDVRIGGNIVIRHSEATPPTWANSTSMDTLPGASTIAVVPLKPGAYILRPRDSSGQFGPQSMLLSSGAQAVAFAPITSLTEDTAFAGAKTNTVAYAGALVLASVDLVSEWPSISGLTSVAWGGGVQSIGTYEFSAGMDFLSVRNVRLRSNIVLESFAVNDLISSRATLLSTWTSINGGDGSDVDCVVEAQTTLDDPAGTPVWSAWSRVDNTEAAVRGVRARAVLTSDDPIYSPLVERLRLYADEVA